MRASEAVWLAATILVALGAGRFIALASLRLPEDRPVEWPGTACAACARPADAVDAVPILGYAARLGRCPRCGAPLPARVPLLEAACAGIALWAMAVAPGAFGALTAVLGWWLLLIAILDAEHLWLPDRLTVPLAVFGLVSAAFLDPLRWLDHALGAAAGFLVLAAIAAAYRRLRGREGLGGGDPRLLAAGGAFVGWMGLPSILLWASAAALSVVLGKILLRRRVSGRDRLPFGTYLALGIWLTWLYGPAGGLLFQA